MTTAERSVNVPAHSAEMAGMLLGLAGVAIFSLTLPFTRMAVTQLDPLFAAMGRAVVAALLAAVWLRLKRAALPPRDTWPALAIVAAGCVIGFPLLTSLAMRTLPASHGAVLVGILPLATALCAALRGHEQPSPAFWCSALAGSGLVVGFALWQGGGRLDAADAAVFAAVLAAAWGYAEGGRLAQRLGGQQVISWALLLALPVALPLAALALWRHPGMAGAAGPAAWLGFGYTCVFSMFLGFFLWYRGLALGGVARVGQVQLVQPFLTLLGATLVLGESLQAGHVAFALAVIGVVAAGRRTAVRRHG